MESRSLPSGKPLPAPYRLCPERPPLRQDSLQERRRPAHHLPELHATCLAAVRPYRIYSRKRAARLAAETLKCLHRRKRKRVGRRQFVAGRFQNLNRLRLSSRATGAGAFGGDVFFFAAGGAVCFAAADSDVSWAASVPAAAKSTASTISANEQVLSERIIVHLGLTLDSKSRQRILMGSFRNRTFCSQLVLQFG